MSTDDAIFQIGDHVWWGDPAAPCDGWIVAFATLPELVYVRYNPPGYARGSKRYPAHAAVTASKLRPCCPICGACLNLGEPCPNKCL